MISAFVDEFPSHLMKHKTLFTACCAAVMFLLGLPLTCKVWASYQIRKSAGCACAWNAGNISPPPRGSDPEMHHVTCVAHVPWCMPGSLSSGFLWSRWRGKHSRHSRRMILTPIKKSRSLTFSILCCYVYWRRIITSCRVNCILCYRVACMC